MNKKIIGSIIVALVLIGGISTYFLSQENHDDSQTIETSQTPTVDTTNSSQILVAYFSMPETTVATNMNEDEDNSVVVVDEQVLGNTQYVAQLIGEQVNGDLYRIEPKTPYPIDHDTLVEQADVEQEENARPEILNTIDGFENYDTIYIGYPIWWGDMPQILYTFLESYDFSDKEVIPFSTHGGSSLAGTPERIKEVLVNANVNTNAFTISRSNMEEAPSEVEQWLKEIKAID